jgi:mono/diheme cytochrome c family protein
MHIRLGWRIGRLANPVWEFVMSDRKTVRRRSGRAFVATVLLTASFGTASAQDPDAGHRLAETWCSNCHVVTAGQSQATSTGAPPFQAIANQSSITPMALHAFLQTPHDRMPDLHLSRNEIDDVSDYILSLRTSPKR